MFNDLIYRQFFDPASSTYTYLLADPQSRQAILIDTVFEQHFHDIALVEELGLKDGRAPRAADWGPVHQSYAGLLEIDPQWVAEYLGELEMLDVRQREEPEERPDHIAGARLISLSELKARLVDVPKERPVVAVGHAGMRSGQATVILRQAEFPRVANLHGGMMLWRQLGLPIVQV
jgi:rhodanese-related sulfurtransferase